MEDIKVEETKVEKKAKLEAAAKVDCLYFQSPVDINQDTLPRNVQDTIYSTNA